MLWLAALPFPASVGERCDVAELVLSNSLNDFQTCLSGATRTSVITAAITGAHLDVLESIDEVERSRICECVTTAVLPSCVGNMVLGAAKGVAVTQAWCVVQDACPRAAGRAELVPLLLGCTSEKEDAKALCECVEERAGRPDATQSVTGGKASVLETGKNLARDADKALRRESPAAPFGLALPGEGVSVLCPGYGSRWPIGSTMRVLWGATGQARAAESVRISLYRADEDATAAQRPSAAAAPRVIYAAKAPEERGGDQDSPKRPALFVDHTPEGKVSPKLFTTPEGRRLRDHDGNKELHEGNREQHDGNKDRAAHDEMQLLAKQAAAAAREAKEGGGEYRAAEAKGMQQLMDQVRRVRAEASQVVPVLVGKVTTATPNNGSFTFRLPTDLRPDDYWLKLTAGPISAWSPMFELTAAQRYAIALPKEGSVLELATDGGESSKEVQLQVRWSFDRRNFRGDPKCITSGATRLTLVPSGVGGPAADEDGPERETRLMAAAAQGRSIAANSLDYVWRLPSDTPPPPPGAYVVNVSCAADPASYGLSAQFHIQRGGSAEVQKPPPATVAATALAASARGQQGGGSGGGSKHHGKGGSSHSGASADDEDEDDTYEDEEGDRDDPPDPLSFVGASTKAAGGGDGGGRAVQRAAGAGAGAGAMGELAAWLGAWLADLSVGGIASILGMAMLLYAAVSCFTPEPKPRGGARNEVVFGDFDDEDEI